MQAVREIVRARNNSIRITIPSSFIGSDIEVVAFPVSERMRHGDPFSDLVGKLAWSGDPVREQRRLRDEW